MKKFSDFLTEAATSQAADKAAKLGLSHVGYGYYGRPDGTVTHRSVNGQLIEITSIIEINSLKFLNLDIPKVFSVPFLI